MSYKPHVSGLVLRAPIYCPECLGKYILSVNRTADTSTLMHPHSQCNRYTDDKNLHRVTKSAIAFIYTRPLGEGTALIQLPQASPVCPKCELLLQYYTMDRLRVTYSHLPDITSMGAYKYSPMGMQPKNCTNTKIYTLAELTVYV